jgi:hypothetical protein
MPNINVLDSIMGSGKTTYMINYMNDTHTNDLGWSFPDGCLEPRKFLYIAVTLDEAQRIRYSCPALEFVEPKPIKGSKLNHLNQAIDMGLNIASTHALFRNVNRESYQALEQARYTLVIDEVVDCVEQYEITNDDIKALFGEGMVYVDQRKRLVWDHERWPNYRGSFDRVRDLCDNGNLVYLEGNILIWELPIKFLDQFEEVWISTYLFDGSLMSNYLRANGVQYRKFTVAPVVSTSPRPSLTGYGLVPERQVKDKLRRLLTIIDDPKLNAIGSKLEGVRGEPLSSSWYQRRLKGKHRALSTLRNNIYNYFNNRMQSPASLSMWTTFKKARSKLKGKGYSKGFVPVNAKATNDYIARAVLAHTCNIFIPPPVKRYFAENGIEADEELFALSELVQWVWRSRIREDLPITLYLPSERMRTLFQRWLRADNVDEFIQVNEAA